MTIKSDEFHLTLTTSNAWDLSSAGRASALQAEGHRFEPCRSHLTNSFISYADVAQLAEQLICNQQVIGSSPIWVVKGLFNPCGVLAQLGEHLPYKQRVIGSSPIGPTCY